MAVAPPIRFWVLAPSTAKLLYPLAVTSEFGPWTVARANARLVTAGATAQKLPFASRFAVLAQRPSPEQKCLRTRVRLASNLVVLV